MAQHTFYTALNRMYKKDCFLSFVTYSENYTLARSVDFQKSAEFHKTADHCNFLTCVGSSAHLSSSVAD